ncbi:MAG: single-stranded-DNA-specific exonuclease RecJ [Pseudomonadota bacterium]
MTNITNTIDARQTSVKGIEWQLAPSNERDILMYSQKFNLPPISAQLLASKSLNLDEATNFLQPKIKNLLPDPSILLDLDKAVAIIIKAINEKQKIVIFGDYDVDGATSSALLYRVLSQITDPKLLSIYIPDRIDEGYGPNVEAFDYLIKQGNQLIITVDCGTLSFEPIAHAKNNGANVVVIDHHLSDTKLPQADAIVNPNRLDQTLNPLTTLAGVGVSFVVLVGLIRELRQQLFFNNKPEPDLMAQLDLVALGTVCDVMQLTGLNRALVKAGLKQMRKRLNLGITAICDLANLQQPANVYHLGFVIGPRINAGGRVGEASLGSTILTTTCPEQAKTIAGKLERYNLERKALEAQMLEQAMAQAEGQQQRQVIFATGQNWHPGVIGIVASRLKEKFNKPTAVIAINNGIGKASARSISGIDFGAAIISAKNEELLIAGGGHAMAAGFTVTEANINTLQEYLEQQFLRTSTAATNIVKHFNAYLLPNAINLQLYQQILQLEPFGNGNPDPRFCLKDVHLTNINFGRNGVAKCNIGSSSNRGRMARATAFGCDDSEIGHLLKNYHGEVVSIIVKIQNNFWQGRSNIELIIEDILNY